MNIDWLREKMICFLSRPG